MSEPCPDCSCHVDGTHYGNCPRIATAFAHAAPQPEVRHYPNVQPHTTAYEREQEALRDRVAVVEHRQRADANRLDNIDVRIREDYARLDAALRRIEALELEVARLKAPDDGWCRCSAHPGPH